MSHTKRTYIVFKLYLYRSWCNSSNSAWLWRIYHFTRDELFNAIVNKRSLDGILEHYVEEPWKVDVTSLPKSSFLTLHNVYYVVHAGKILSLEYLNREVSKRKLEPCKKKKSFAKTITTTYAFRFDPVPGIGRWSCKSFYRVGHLGQVRKKNNYGRDDEYRKYNSTKYAYKNLPQWDDTPRHSDRSWKTSYKCRKQWQKKTCKHTHSTVMGDAYASSTERR